MNTYYIITLDTFCDGTILNDYKADGVSLIDGNLVFRRNGEPCRIIARGQWVDCGLTDSDKADNDNANP